jgi:hypothetical protein
MHTSFFRLSILLGITYTTQISAYPILLFPQSFHLAISASHQNQNQYPLLIPPPTPSHSTQPYHNSSPIYGIIHMRSPLHHDVPLSFTLKTSTYAPRHPVPQNALKGLSSKILAEHPVGITFPDPSEPLRLSSSTKHRIDSQRNFTVALGLSLRMLPEEGGEKGEDHQDVEGIGAGELGFLFRLFERAIEDLDVALQDSGAGIWSMVLEGEVEGMEMRCEFGMSCED